MKKVYNYSFGVAICLNDRTWIEKETCIRIRSSENIGLRLEALMIWQAKEDFAKIYHTQGYGMAITWTADFITEDMKGKARNRQIIELDDWE